MRKATKTVATWFGFTAGIAGMEHGIFEILQGNTRPEGLVIASIGPPCVSDQAWNACEPAMTVIPNFLISGILSVIIGLVIVIWSLGFMRQRFGGVVLVGLSIVLLLFGGGFFPPLIGLIGGLAGLKINQPIHQTQSSSALRFMSALWPCPLVVFLVWVFGQWVVGTLFNDFLQSVMIYGVLLILTMMPLSIASAYAHDLEIALTGEEHETI